MMLTRNKDLFKKHDDKTSMLLPAHAFYAKCSPSHIPYSISLILQDYDDIFPKDIPRGLPPFWGIEHQNNFIMG